MRKKPIVLLILDGYGISQEQENNAIFLANTPNMDTLTSQCPSSRLACSGMAVGLPDGQMGNSEVGHTNMGAGRIVYQELTRITKAIQDRDFFENKTLSKTMKNCKEKGIGLHLLGLLSDGGVHSHNQHLYALLEMAKQYQLEKVYVHCLMDGRDVPPSSGESYILDLQKAIDRIGVGKIATVAGRYYGMDRDNRWERVEMAYNAIANADGILVDDPYAGVLESYKKEVTDEFIMPMVCQGYEGMQNGDAMICFNFRPDRAREITRTFVDERFSGFSRKGGYKPVSYVCFTQYDATMPNVEVAFEPQSLKNTFGEYISNLGLTQLRIAETEKYAHVTFFFNGGAEDAYKGEDRCLIPSPKVATYDLKPEMSAYEVCDTVLERIASDQYDVIILNFANCDMVGHTGVMSAAIAAVEVVDTCVGKIVAAVRQKGGVTVITSDHGNSDKMVDDDGEVPFTAHTTNDVPFIVDGVDRKVRDGGLSDIAPTLLDILGIEKPAEMTGNSLLI
jgi:2,3-bisphosphoglycerate-independent phosphoglycerate mutase